MTKAFATLPFAIYDCHCFFVTSYNDHQFNSDF